MPGCVRVFAGVTIWRAVAAERHAARLAGAQMNPVRTGLHAFLADPALRVLDAGDVADVRADPVGCHRSLPLTRGAPDGRRRRRSIPRRRRMPRV